MASSRRLLALELPVAGDRGPQARGQPMSVERHLHVHDRDIGAVIGGKGDRLLGVTCGRDDPELRAEPLRQDRSRRAARPDSSERENPRRGGGLLDTRPEGFEPSTSRSGGARSIH